MCDFLTLRFLPRLSWLFALSFFRLLLGFESGTWKTFVLCSILWGISQETGPAESTLKGAPERPFCFNFMSCSPHDYRWRTIVKRGGNTEVSKIPSVSPPKHKRRKGSEENQNKCGFQLLQDKELLKRINIKDEAEFQPTLQEGKNFELSSSCLPPFGSMPGVPDSVCLVVHTWTKLQQAQKIGNCRGTYLKLLLER